MLQLYSFCEQCPPGLPELSPSPGSTEVPRLQIRLLVSFPPLLFRWEGTEAALLPLPGVVCRGVT